MARTNKAFDATIDTIESAKETAVALMQNATVDALDLFYTDDLEYIENGIKKLNDYSNKSWLLSAILLYTLVYDKGLYAQSGLSWIDYQKEARERIGLDQRDISNQLSCARFFINNRAELERQGFTPEGKAKNLSRAEQALELSGDVHEVIKHVVNDTFLEFKEWYSSFKEKKALPTTENKREDIEINKDKFYINKVEAVKISDKIPESDKVRLEKYLNQIFDAMKRGFEPAIIECYDGKEARALPKLRDKYRQGK
ncbi:MAG: hypothetical protein K6E54_11255 [Bacteroidaceae bacterium]|nr:hypothetical protein [Bacteroidaceae bacterium]